MLAGSSPVLLSAFPGAEGRDPSSEASRRASANANDVILAALADGLSVPSGSNRIPKDTMVSTNGSKNEARAKDKVRVALIGVGNCASSLLQGESSTTRMPPPRIRPGPHAVDLGGYHISDIEFTAAFDVVKGKVGADLADAIWAQPNERSSSQRHETGIRSRAA